MYHELSFVASSLADARKDLTVVRAADTEEAVEELCDAGMILISNSNWEDDFLEGLSNGDWIQSTSAGYNSLLLAEFRERGIRFTNAAETHGSMVAEHVFSLVFTHSRDLFQLRAKQEQADWDHSFGMALGDWLGKTLTIVGLGRIGEAIAERGQAFSMKVSGIKRHPDNYEGCVPDNRVHGPDGLAGILPGTDLLVLSVPLTRETHHLVDAEVLAALPESTVLINIARGEVVDETALVDAFEADEIAGAGLDVVEREPLPADSPLWDCSDAIITPHVAGLSDGFSGRIAALFLGTTTAAGLRNRWTTSSPERYVAPSLPAGFGNRHRLLPVIFNGTKCSPGHGYHPSSHPGGCPSGSPGSCTNLPE